MSEKMRVHILAKELSVPSKTIIEKCKAEGISSVKNHMSTLSAGLHATICEWFTEGSVDTAVETADRIDLERVRIRRPRKKKAPPETAPAFVGQGGETNERVGELLPAAAEAAPTAQAGGVATETIAERPAPPVADVPGPETAQEEVLSTPVAEVPTETTAPVLPRQDVSTDAGSEAPPPDEGDSVAARQDDAAPEKEASAEQEPAEQERAPVAPAGPQNVPERAKLQGPRVVRYEAPDDTPRPVRRGGSRRAGELVPTAERDVTAPTDGGAGRKKGRINPRRGAGRTADAGAGERQPEWRNQDLIERRERLAGATGRRIHRRRSTGGPGGGSQHVTIGPKTEATVHEPVRMKEFCSATGLNFMQCFRMLRDEHHMLANVNMTLPTDTAHLLAMQSGIDLIVIPAKTKLDELQEEFEQRERSQLAPRPPVVTMLGHVDHGKTSLLDAIRKTHVVRDEDGGITQHIGAYYIQTRQGAVTFLDTPGHEAFTAMRARGAQLTDVVVLVVAADDGLMPQTLEAISHAKAASVPIVVALNKIDLGDQNRLKIFGQLSEHGLTPSGDWGGEVDVIETSATTGKGITNLVEHLAALNSLLDLKADPTVPAKGAVVEAQTKPGVGAVISLLVQEGTLRVGDFVVCGPAYGKVRALMDDRGRRVSEAGPAMPVEVWGLDEVPAAGDLLYTIDSLQRAKDVAMETRQVRLESARVQSRKANTLEEMFKRRDAAEVPELNIIIKADVDGSIAALRQSLGELPSDEVRLTVRHAAVGGVNDSDILLAAACVGIVVAFRVDISVGVRRMAEQHGVDVRPYRVIYDVCDDIKKALEGLLAPEQRLESRGRAEVRQLFRLSRKAGVIAGSYVTEGTVDRSHLARIVRDGVIVREGCKFASLRRFKDDAKEARAGLECGIRLDGFDDVHIGDVIETYEVVEVARTL